ncbi:MAG: hypothetical protein HQM13_19535 [SAR324 cluster bacterium]|nr:hypothetical protein [SAR324 cluster bacterium]
MALDFDESPIEQESKKIEEKKGELKKKKIGKKVFINEDLFGASKTLEDSPAEEGISHLKIKAQELGNIPGMIEHWRAEINSRKKEILDYSQTTFVQRAANRFRGWDFVSPEVTGEELARHHPTKAALEKVKLLKRNPKSMMDRLELVSIVAKSGREFPVELYRTLLLQATVACSFGEFSNVGLQMVIWTQDIYFSKLYYKCQGEALALEAKLKTEEGKQNAFTRQSQGLRNHIALVTRNMEIIKNYQKQTEKAIKENKAVYNTSLSFEEVTDFLLELGGTDKIGDDKKRDTKWKSILKRAAELLLLLRVLPLLDIEAKKLSSQLKKVDKNDPIPYFLEAKVQMSDLIFKVGIYQGGERTVEMREKVQESFKNTLHYYGLAVKRVGKMPKSKMEFAIFIEYASLIHYFYKVSTTTLGIRLPAEWLSAVFNKAMKLLELVQEKGNVDGLVMDIQRDILEEGFDKSGTNLSNKSPVPA